jgi:hypothetical protein
VLGVIPSVARDRYLGAAVELPWMEADPSSLTLLGMTPVTVIPSVARDRSLRAGDQRPEVRDATPRLSANAAHSAHWTADYGHRISDIRKSVPYNAESEKRDITLSAGATCGAARPHPSAPRKLKTRRVRRRVFE